MEKTNGQFKYDLNQIPYDYTVEVMNRFKGLNLVVRMPKELWTKALNTVQETGTKPSQRKRNARGKMVGGGFTNS